MASRRLINTMACIRPFSCHLDRLIPSSSALPKVLSNDFVVPFLLKGRPILSAPFQCMKFSSNEEENDTHDDFKPVNKSVCGTSSIEEFIEKDIKEHNIMVYMKGIPEAPQCGFSKMVVEILQHHAVPFAARNVLADQDLRDGIKKFSHWPTIPQVFIKGEFVGGSDILLNMHRSGELEEKLKEFKIATK